VAAGTPKDFYVEQTLCVECGRPTVRIGLPLIDLIRSGGKEPVVCGTCLIALKERLENMRGQEESEDLPDWGSDTRRSL
jgi:hypothetical protein